jgi:cysteine desulfurase
MSAAKDSVIYLDYQATTPVDRRVLDAMLPFFAEKFGNPHSSSHAFGAEARDAVEVARQQLADLIGAEAREVVFTSGATESNNLAIKGAGRFWRERKPHVVTVATEHKCVLESVKALEAEGVEVTCLGVGPGGLVDLGALEAAIRDDTALVSVMAVNNEIGVIQPLAEIGRLTRAKGCLFHTDAAQATGKIALDVNDMNIDLMSISGHKMYGPMGVGALYVRRRPRARIDATMSGGGQERGVRSGTVPAPLAVGIGEAAAIAFREMAEESTRIAALRDRFLARIRRATNDVALNGDAEQRIPGNLSLTFPGIDAEKLMASLKGVAVSSGSACTSAAVEPSYVLRGIGLDDAAARATIRVGIGRQTTEDEVDRAADEIVREVGRLRNDETATRETPVSAA